MKQGELRVRDVRELEMLALVAMANWLQQAEDVSANGFGRSDRERLPYWMDGETPGHSGHWLWAGEGGMRVFRVSGYRSMLDLIDSLESPCAAAVRVSFSLVYERLGEKGAENRWVPEMAVDCEAPKL